MKKFITIFIVLFTIISCQITEQYYLGDSDNVHLKYKVDLSSIMGMINEKSDIDSLKEIGEYPIDSVMTFGELIRRYRDESDTISESERRLEELMKDVEFRLQINDDYANLIMDFGDRKIDDFNRFMSEYEKIMKEYSEVEKQELPMNVSISSVDLKYKNGFFEKNITEEEIEATIKTEETDSISEMAKNFNEQLYKMFIIKQEFHFPKKVKKVNVEEATLSLDGKTVIIETTFEESKSKYKNIQIELED